MSPPTPAGGAYSSHQDAGGAVVKGKWLAGVCDGCCDDCCSCLVPTFCPCIGIGEAASAVSSEGSALCWGLTCGLLIFTTIVSDGLFAAKGITQDSGWKYYSGYGYYHYDNGIKVVYTSAVISVVSALSYAMVVASFRTSFRSKLQLPGDGCCDCCLSLFCSCCVVAQVRAHVKRSAAANVDTLPAYQVN